LRSWLLRMDSGNGSFTGRGRVRLGNGARS
jgi:hypothetical protein